MKIKFYDQSDKGWKVKWWFNITDSYDDEILDVNIFEDGKVNLEILNREHSCALCVEEWNAITDFIRIAKHWPRNSGSMQQLESVTNERWSKDASQT